MKWDDQVPEFISDIARSMGLDEPDGQVTVKVRLRILAMMNSIHNFISGEDFFRSTLDLSREEYIPLAKETLKFIMIPAFTGERMIAPAGVAGGPGPREASRN